MGTFTGKHLCYSFFFNKNIGLQACHFIKKRLQYICFLDNTEKFLRTAIFKNICIGQFFLLYKFERFSPWKNNIRIYIRSEKDLLLKTKKKHHSKTQPDEIFAFSWCSLSSRFPLLFYCMSGCFYLHNKRW